MQQSGSGLKIQTDRNVVDKISANPALMLSTVKGTCPPSPSLEHNMLPLAVSSTPGCAACDKTVAKIEDGAERVEVGPTLILFSSLIFSYQLVAFRNISEASMWTAIIAINLAGFCMMASGPGLVFVVYPTFPSSVSSPTGDLSCKTTTRSLTLRKIPSNTRRFYMMCIFLLCFIQVFLFLNFEHVNSEGMFAILSKNLESFERAGFADFYNGLKPDKLVELLEPLIAKMNPISYL